MKAVWLLALLLSGCATFANTPAQDRTWAAYEACRDRVPRNIQVTRVEPDGRYWYQWVGSPYGMGVLQECMRDEVAKRRG
jgi:hypothetical protein